MNKSFYLLTIVLCLVIASCDDEHNVNGGEGNGDTSFWAQSHTTLVGVKGMVSRVTENTYALKDGAEIDPATLLDMSFNAADRMTYYNATGMEPETPETRGVWQTMAYYSYQYDRDGKMVQATVTPVGDEPMVYHLTYDEHAQYVPLIFPLGGMDFFLVKGLKSIVSEDETVSYTFDGTKASYKQEAWTGDIETVYSYAADSPYPVKKVVTTSRGEDILGVETTTYTYGEKGRLLKTDVRALEGGAETLRTITNYAEAQSLLPLSVKMDMGGFMADWTYTYNSELRLQKVDYIENKGSEDEVTDKEEYEYTSADSNGNWTDSKQLQSSIVNMSHLDGLIGVRRTIIYQ